MSETESKVGNISTGDQIHFWMYDQTWTERHYSGTVISIDWTEIGGEARQFFVVAEMPDKKILATQIERVTQERTLLNEFIR